jgi:hypothetical protein
MINQALQVQQGCPPLRPSASNRVSPNSSSCPFGAERPGMSRAGHRVGSMGLFGLLGFEPGVIEAHRYIALRSWRIIGRDGTRRATVLNPVRAKVEA